MIVFFWGGVGNCTKIHCLVVIGVKVHCPNKILPKIEKSQIINKINLRIKIRIFPKNMAKYDAKIPPKTLIELFPKMTKK
jgi:hypothetical protein